jgi:hypothetical protein
MWALGIGLAVVHLTYPHGTHFNLWDHHDCTNNLSPLVSTPFHTIGVQPPSYLHQIGSLCDSLISLNFHKYLKNLLKIWWQLQYWTKATRSIHYGNKVETPVYDNIRELVTWECKRTWSEIVNVLANLKGSVGRWNLNFWRLEQFYTNFWNKGVVDTYSSRRLIQNKQRSNCEATIMMARKSRCIY